MTKRALVLSGGSILGSFQAGAIAEVLESGFVPDAIYGTSVGSLNGGFLAERAGRAKKEGEDPDWPGIGRELESFCLDKLASPSMLAKKRTAWAIFHLDDPKLVIDAILEVVAEARSR